MTQIVMPYITVGIAQHQPESVAWRYAFLVPACAFVVIAILIMTFTQARPPARAPACLRRALRCQRACASACAPRAAAFAGRARLDMPPSA